MNAKTGKHFSNKSIFWLAVVLGIMFVVGLAGYTHYTGVRPVKFARLTTGIAVTEQIQLKAIPYLPAEGFATVIDLRPDGEAADEPPAVVVESAVHASRMNFAYVPVPHGDIPAGAVTALARAMAENPKPILLYCRSGRRAARTWSLVEASRSDGLDAADILAAVKAGGQSAEDLDTAIAARIANRSVAAGAMK